jgi:hypothetical protein
MNSPQPKNGSRTNIVSSRSGLSPGARAARGFVPTRMRFVHRRDFSLIAGLNRQVVEGFVSHLVSRANLDFIEAVENVELGERNPVDSTGGHGLTHQYGVKPAAAALSSRNRAEFRPGLSDAFSGFVSEFGRKWPLANARRIGLGNAQHESNVAWAAA